MADNDALIKTTLPKKTRAAALAELSLQATQVTAADEDALKIRTERQIRSFLAGRRKEFTLPVDISSGTTFQQQIWELTRVIPYGKVSTYLELARAAGRPGAARAVGQCMALNPLPLIIPCHRVVGSSGNLRGFGGGLPMKRRLLRMEGAL